MQTDKALEQIAQYVHHTHIDSEEALETARLCLADALGCAIYSLQFRECTKLLGPSVPWSIIPNGARVPGTSFVLDPVTAAFNIGTMIRWLDFNDTWLGEEWGHPSDNIGGLLAVSDYLCQAKQKELKVRDLLTAMIKAYEIQGILALRNSFNRIGFDHVIFVKVATAAVVSHMLGGSYSQTVDAISQAFIDGVPLRTYRHAPNTGSRKSWAAGDATSRGVQLAHMTMQGEMGYPQALSAKKWGFYDVYFQGKPFNLERSFGSYVIEHILFKIAFPAEFHAQTAVECAIELHPQLKHRLNEIEWIDIDTHESAIRIIDKTGPLTNPADRDHCLQYMVANALLHGTLTAEHYEDAHHARHPHIDLLRQKIRVKEHKPYSHDYLHPDKRSIASRLTIHFKDGSTLGPLEIEYPLGHKKRRKEAYPLLFEKLEKNLSTKFDNDHTKKIVDTLQNPARLYSLTVSEFNSLFCGGY